MPSLRIEHFWDFEKHIVYSLGLRSQNTDSSQTQRAPVLLESGLWCLTNSSASSEIDYSYGFKLRQGRFRLDVRKGWSGWSGTGIGCPERWWSHRPWWCSKSVWMLCWGTWFSENHWWRAHGWTGWSCGSFPTLAILWFNDSMTLL